MDGPGSLPGVEIDFKKAGKWLRQAREDLHLSTRELAKMCSISAAQISRMETGEDFTVSKLVRLAVAVGLPPGLVIDYNLIVRPGFRGKEHQAALMADPELSAIVSAHKENDVVPVELAILDLVDLVTVCACKLLVSASPEATLQALEISPPSLRENCAGFIRAYGLATDSAERATVFRAIVRHPLRKLRALRLLTKEVIEEYLLSESNTSTIVQENLTKSLENDSADLMLETAAAWLHLRARTSKVTSHRGEQARLARDLNVSRQSVNNWLAGVSSPSADLTLRLLDWVTAAEGKQK